MTAAARRKERHRAVPMLPEVRRIEAHNLEIRESDTDASGDTVVVEGMWCRYNVGYMVPDAFGEFEERMLPGVCGDLMTRADVRFLVDHNPSMLLARTKSGTLTLADSKAGAMMRAVIDLRDSDARNLVVRLERGDVSQMSCGFIVARDKWNEAYDERDVELFRDLLDVSSVTYPASPTTDIDIARRMLMGAPVESRARLRRMVSEVRAGKVLSSKNVDRVNSAVKTLGELLNEAGAVEDAEADGVTLPGTGEDGATDTGGLDGGDGSGARSTEQPEGEQRSVERRDAASYSELEQQVATALGEHLEALAGDFGIVPDWWLADCGPEWAVFTVWASECQSFRIEYTMGDEGNVTFGGYSAVDRVTSWQPSASEERSDPVVTDDTPVVPESRSTEIRLRILAASKRRV